MPTRSGLDFHAIHPDFFVCAYCYEAIPNYGIQFRGMITKPVMHEIDGRWLVMPDQTTRIWTGAPPSPHPEATPRLTPFPCADPHCWRCHRRVIGLPELPFARRAHKY